MAPDMLEIRHLMTSRFRTCAPVLLCGAMAWENVGCSSDAAPSTAASAASANCAVTIDRFKELMIVDDAVIGDARARNDQDGHWSFRHAVEEMLPAGMSPSAFVDAWMAEWAPEKTINGFLVDRTREWRNVGVNTVWACPWLHATEANGCDADCSSCTARVFDLAKAPFRLLAFANRMDLGGRSDVRTGAGEARLVFALTSGPGDDPASKALPMTAVFEYGLEVDPRTPRQWADLWHGLSAHAAFDEDFKRDLDALTESFVRRGAAPLRQNGSAISQVRTNESAFQWFWQFRQFALDGSGHLGSAAVTNTPDFSLDDSQTLSNALKPATPAIDAHTYVLPLALLGASSDLMSARWTLPGLDDTTRAAFAQETCNGCHSGEHPTLDTAFHVSPYRAGTAKLSTFLNDPANTSGDELARRGAIAKTLLCQ